MNSHEKQVAFAFRRVGNDIAALQAQINLLRKEQERLSLALRNHSADTKNAESSLENNAIEQKFVASKNGTYFHSSESLSAAKILPENRIYFPSALAALSQGFQPGPELGSDS